ncbi:cellobiose phosphorylase [Enterococcus sp. S86.2]|uniref:GH36-type glycosyl hydrolase domain-containing protein n=1 Tax=Enterococcus sp. S86.2 TaxID=3031299 RepID=UPI0026F00064|nr:cellobiose phosphorylase [Enterococcus sp. S86.2]
MKQIILNAGDVQAAFLPTGDLYELCSNEIMINQLDGNALDGSVNQIYLRIFDEKITAIPLIGSNTNSTFSQNENGVTWQGSVEEIRYQVDFTLSKKNIWFWTITLKGEGQVVDVIFGQDLGNAAKGAVQSNEAYMSQYVDHKVTQQENGYIITSRQNQPQGGEFPVVEHGSLTKNRGFLTDGYQFFGTNYKTTATPQALAIDQFENEVYQYEFAYPVLQSEKMTLQGEAEVVFYGGFKNNHPKEITEALFTKEQVAAAYQKPVVLQNEQGNTRQKKIGAPLTGKKLTAAEIDALFPEKNQVEVVDGSVLSFFTPNYHHVVLQEKEEQMERATGHILLSGTDLTVDKPLLATTAYMYGIFNSQVVLGNTSMNKLMSNSRNSLNVLKHSGQRLYVKEGENWRVLTMPSAFEMGLNSATWYYQLDDDLLTITTYTIANGREIRLNCHSAIGKNYTFALTSHLLMGAQETPTYQMTQTGNQMTIKPAASSPVNSEYPDLIYYMTMDTAFSVTDESLFGVESSDLQVVVLEDVSGFESIIQGTLTGADFVETKTDLIAEDAAYVAFVDSLLHNFKLEHETADVSSMNYLSRWYVHNMLVHYLSPHGLEQYGGAAWGTRDVSQGPTEFFFAINRPEVVKDIIKKVYANQFDDDGNWPQWFMFDRYETQKADESHGDVIVWPMKIIADYLAKTADYSILQEKLPYTKRSDFHKTAESYTLFDHLKKEVQYIEDNFLAGTYLSCYGDGDWDDTLQPYDSRLKKHMASSWTVALTYQVMNKLSHVLATEDAAYSQHLEKLVAGIKTDFTKYILGTDVIPGFVYMEEDGTPELMIHPTDKKTGIQYRLLPMTRSMIAELLTPKQAQAHLAVIKENLQFPDGVRLMNRPAHYAGGVSTNFKRAEQAANFGREIGLQYVHAHIRFTEAMAKLGKTEETWRALQTINPINLKERVKNAKLRQANVYFSSSDGDFKTRYEAQENFGKLRDGSVDVKGGWRIYSSGPGIYLNQLLTNVLGLREDSKTIVLDPVLPAELDGLKVNYALADAPVAITFYTAADKKRKVVINGKVVETKIEANPYRTGGFVIDKKDFKEYLKDGNQIAVYC